MSDPGGPARYEIRVDGVLDNKWADWFGGLQVSSDGTQTAISGLLADQPALHGALSRHLAHEERETLPLLSRTLTRAEWHGFVADQQRKSGIRGAAQLFPWLLDEASPEQAQAVLAQLPAPLRVANRRIWRPRYARHAHWEPAASVPRALAPAPPSEPSVTSPAGDAVPRDGSRAGRPHGALERALEYARHGRSIGGESPLEEEVLLTPSRRQLRRREAGWEGSPRRNPAPRNTNRVGGGAIWVSLLKKARPVTINRVVM